VTSNLYSGLQLRTSVDAYGGGFGIYLNLSSVNVINTSNTMSKTINYNVLDSCLRHNHMRGEYCIVNLVSWMQHLLAEQDKW